nr:hypothetical protein [uncultured Albidiferax sp.]
MDDYLPTEDEINEWLKNNRQYSTEVRVEALTKTLRNVDIDTLRHYAAAFFVARDVAAGGLAGLPEFFYPRLVRVIEESKSLGDTQHRKKASALGRARVNARYDKPGGTRDKQKEIIARWATGNFRTRDICAQEEADFVGMKYAAARKALTGTPNPAPWPAKTR